jgi:hypothetical protein
LRPGEAEVDRFFAENRFSGLGRGLDQVGVGVGRGRDEDGVDRGVADDGVVAARLDAVFGGELRGRFFDDVGDGDQLAVRMRRDRFRVDVADAAGAEKTNLEHVSSS